MIPCEHALAWEWRKGGLYNKNKPQAEPDSERAAICQTQIGSLFLRRRAWELKALPPIPLLITIGATSTSAPCMKVKCSVGVIPCYITSLRYDGLGPYVETYFTFCSDGEHMVMDIASMCSPIIYARRRSILQTHIHLYFKFGLPMERHRHHYFCCIEFD